MAEVSYPVVDLRVYPVKSLQGHSVASAEITARGLLGDRSHGLRDVASGTVLTARRDQDILFATGVRRADGSVSVRLPDGREASDSATISEWLGRPIELIGARDQPSTYEISIDFEDDDSEVVSWQGPAGSFHDSTRTQVSIIATGDLRAWDIRRFRPNVLVDAPSIDHLVGSRVRLGTAELDVVKQIDRCVMVTRPQPGGIDRDLGVLRTINAERGSLLGVGALVGVVGHVGVGDRLSVV